MASPFAALSLPPMEAMKAVRSKPAAPSASDWALRFALQFVIGGGLGVAFGVLFPQICRQAKLMQSGLYPLVSIAWLLLMFGVSTLLGGNGYLTLYIAGILTSRVDFPFKKTILAFNHFNNARVACDVGIGTAPSDNPDWTFSANAGAYRARRISVWVK